MHNFLWQNSILRSGLIVAAIAAKQRFRNVSLNDRQRKCLNASHVANSRFSNKQQRFVEYSKMTPLREKAQ